MTKKQNNLTMYRRHAASCEVSKPKILDKCECPLWVHGKLRGKFIRESLETRGQIAGLLKVQAMLDGKGGDDPTPGGGIALIGNVPNSERTLESAVEVLMSGKKKRASNTKKLYTNAFGHFRAYAEAHERVLLSQIDTDFMHQYFAEYDAGWKQATAQGRLTHLRVLFNFCKKKKWITDAPTADADLNYTKGKIGTGKVKRVPFKPHEVTAILAAIEQLPEEIRDRARALIYLMLYTGCRISDATFFEREYLTASNTANYYVIKTRKLISLAPEVQQAALDALKRLPESDAYFFQPDADDDYRAARTALRDGAEFSTLMPDYEARVRETTALVVKVLRLAKLDGACHRFRDTFAVNALTTGCDIFSLSQMLGHSDVRITQDHYLKLVDGYQVQMSQKTRGLAYIFPMTVAS